MKIFINLFKYLNQMYAKIELPLADHQIKMVNASVLALKYKCSSSYVSRVLKLKEVPNSVLARKILGDAISVIGHYENFHKTKKSS